MLKSPVVKTPKPPTVEQILSCAIRGIWSAAPNTIIGPPKMETKHPARLSFCNISMWFGHELQTLAHYFAIGSLSPHLVLGWLQLLFKRDLQRHACSTWNFGSWPSPYKAEVLIMRPFSVTNWMAYCCNCLKKLKKDTRMRCCSHQTTAYNTSLARVVAKMAENNSGVLPSSF